MDVLRKKGPCVIDRSSLWGQAAVTVMICSAVFRLIGSINLPDDPQYMIWQLALPLGCNLLFVLCIVLLGKKGFFLSFIPATAGMLFFVLNAAASDSKLAAVIWTAVWVLVLLIYACTVFGVFRGKWLLALTVSAVFLYRTLFTDLPRLQDTLDPPAFSAGMLEMSSLCILLALLFTALGMTRKAKSLEEMELPKIKPPIVKIPGRGEAQPAAGSTEAHTEPAADVSDGDKEQPAQPLTGADVTAAAAPSEPEAERSDT